MPKRPKFIHPVRSVRDTLGLSQPHFAKRVGTSESTIKSVENGKLAVSRSLALRICAETGAEPSSLMVKRGKAVDVTGEPYSSESIKRKGKPLPPEIAAGSIERAGHYLEILLAASAQKGRFAQVLISFDEWIQTARQEFGLESATSEILKEKTFRKSAKGYESWEHWGSVRTFLMSNQERLQHLDFGEPVNKLGKDLLQSAKETAAKIKRHS